MWLCEGRDAIGRPLPPPDRLAGGAGRPGPMTAARGQPQRLRLDPDRFAQVERRALYEVANAVLLAQIELQQSFGLRAEEAQILFLIALSAVQRQMRAPAPEDLPVDQTPLSAEQPGTISRRRIAETVGIPLETARRQVARLIDLGLVVERGRGRLSTPGGMLQWLASQGLSLALVQRHLAATNALLRLEVLTEAAPHPA